MNFRCVWLFLMIFSLVACSSTLNDDPLTLYHGQSAAQIFARGTQALKAEHYRDAAGAFEALTALYPFSTHSEQAQLDLVYAYFKQGDNASAVAAAERYIHLYPQGQHIDYVYYLKGRANIATHRSFLSRYIHIEKSERDLSTEQAAYQDFYTVVYRFPDSPYAADARQHLIALRNEFAEHELNIARFYTVRNVYLAAANRASNIVEHYQHSPQVAEALAIMVKAYQKIKLPKRAAEARAILVKKLPPFSVC